MKIFSPILKGTTTVVQGTTNLSGSFTGSLFGTAATASYADNFTVGGTLTAQTINVQIITSSIEFNTGSTRNGALSSNTHQFTGSVLVTGSLTVTGSATFSSDVILPYSKALAFNSISNQYITADATNLYLGTANLARLIIASTGNTTIMTNDNIVLKATNVNQAMYIDYRNSVGTRRFYMGFGGDSTSNFDIWNSENGAIVFGTNSTERMRIIATGEVCVASTTAANIATGRGNLTIGGSSTSILAFRPASVDSGYLYHNGGSFSLVNNVTGGVYVSCMSGGVVLSNGATSWASSSDERLKNINSNIENAIDKLSLLRTVNFSWKSDTTNKELLGLIAQDIEQVLPQVVDRNKLPADINGEQTDETEYLNVRYTELIPVLVKAIQELKSENDTLKEILQRNNIQ
jgi:hypothetical protein